MLRRVPCNLLIANSHPVVSLTHAVVRLCNWQCSNVLADWAKNPDKPPIFENPPGRPDKGQKRGRVRGNPDVW